MKAYYLSIKDDDDAGAAITFANTAKEAKKNYYKYEWLADALGGEWIYLRVCRSPEYDGMENLSEAELYSKAWKNGWRWVDHYNCPDPDEDTEQEFISWYEDTFGLSQPLSKEQIS